MNTIIKRFLELKGFETRQFDKSMCLFVRIDRTVIVEIVLFSETEFNVNIKSNFRDSNLAFSRKVYTSRSEDVKRPIECSDIISAFYSCRTMFETTLNEHVENIKSIHDIFI